MENCIFCKIVRGEIPGVKIYEDEYALGLLDIHPVTKGHAVVIPKVHAELLFDLDDELTPKFFMSVKRALERMKEVLSPDGFNVGWNNGPAGGQSVPHLHVHIIPRWNGDGGGNMHSIVHKESDLSVAEVAQLFQTQK